MPRPSWRRYTSTPRPSSAIRLSAASSWSPQSQRCEPSASPLRHSECTRTNTGSPLATSPSVSATSSAFVVPKRALYAWIVNSPYFVGIFAVATRSTSFSRAMRYAMRSLTVIIRRPCRFAKRLSSGSRDIEPFGGHGHADHTACVLTDERDVLGCAELRRDSEVAFVLTILIVDDDHHPAPLDLVNRFGDGRECAPRCDHSRSRWRVLWRTLHRIKSRVVVTLSPANAARTSRGRRTRR